MTVNSRNGKTDKHSRCLTISIRTHHHVMSPDITLPGIMAPHFVTSVWFSIRDYHIALVWHPH